MVPFLGLKNICMTNQYVPDKIKTGNIVITIIIIIIIIIYKIEIHKYKCFSL